MTAAKDDAARAMLAALRTLHRWAQNQNGWDATEWRDVREAIAAAEAAGIKGPWTARVVKVEA